MQPTDPDRRASGEPLAGHRRRLLAVFERALAAVDGRRLTRLHLSREALAGPVHAIALGKAAAAMMGGALDALGPDLAQALVITKSGHCQGLPAGITCLESAHPVPDERSLGAGRALLEFLARAPAQASLLVLVSGGASSLVEALPGGVGAAELARLNRWLLGSGLDIHRMNRLRKRLSTIKGGRLAAALGGRPTRVLLISDVPGDDPRSIGSGLLVPHVEADLDLGPEPLPQWVQDLCGAAPPLPGPGAFAHVRSQIIATAADAGAAAARAAEDLGFAVRVHPGLLSGDARQVGRTLGRRVLHDRPGLQVWTGESTVALPPRPGRGGRCQHLALAAALELAGQPGALLLAGATDGGDGPGEDAGALVDGTTLARGVRAGLDAQGALAAADAGTFLEAAGDLLHTGPTGTNVMDLVLGLKLAG